MPPRKAKEDFRTPNALRPLSIFVYNLFVNLMLNDIGHIKAGLHKKDVARPSRPGEKFGPVRQAETAWLRNRPP